MKDIAAIILAAGKGTRMQSELPKVLHPICGRPMIDYVWELLKKAGIKKIVGVVGHRSGLVEPHLSGAKIVRQTRLLGSGDAVARTEKFFRNYKGSVVILYGDVPLIKEETLKGLILHHQKTAADCTVLAASFKDPTGYGRVIRNAKGKVIRIAEEDEATIYEKVIEEINVGLICVKAEVLFSALKKIKDDNARQEYYLTDAIEIISKQRLKIETFQTEDEEEVIGINKKDDLLKAAQVLKGRIMERLSSSGVRIVDPATTSIDYGVTIGEGTVIRQNTVIERDVKIGKGCHIGPFAHLRPYVELDEDVEVGNFVELVRTKVGRASRIKHHTYLGDAVVGEDVNIGAGVITANYDGKKKDRTTIGSGAFIGIGTMLIAPVEIGKGAVTGAGSVVTKGQKIPAGVTVSGVPARILKKSKLKSKNCTSKGKRYER